MSIQEECGVFDVSRAKTEDVASLVNHGLYALQHRGQADCGFVVNDDGVFTSRKWLGPVSEASNRDRYCCACFSGRYPTAIPEDTRKDQFEERLSRRQTGVKA